MTPSTHPSEYDWQTAAPSHIEAYLLSPLSQLLPAPDKLANSSVLDIGCGNGWLTAWLADLGCVATGIDPSSSGIEQARLAHPHLNFYSSPATPDLLQTLGLNPFDLVVSTEVVEHCYAPRVWAAACFNSLRPGGQLICSTPYHGYFKNLALALAGHFDSHFTALWDGGHIKFWSYHTLSQLLTEAGFVDLKFMGAGRIPYLWKSMLFSACKPNP
jgi:2-polyprenyl-6-hydroxyphenyl methylase/3-demethylubiquinone-9 3-methyltransferase